MFNVWFCLLHSQEDVTFLEILCTLISTLSSLFWNFEVRQVPTGTLCASVISMFSVPVFFFKPSPLCRFCISWNVCGNTSKADGYCEFLTEGPWVITTQHSHSEQVWVQVAPWWIQEEHAAHTPWVKTAVVRKLNWLQLVVFLGVERSEQKDNFS